MALFDSLPEEWRALVHEYGLPRVVRLYALDVELAEAEEALREHRRNRSPLRPGGDGAP